MVWAGAGLARLMLLWITVLHASTCSSTGLSARICNFSADVPSVAVHDVLDCSRFPSRGMLARQKWAQCCWSLAVLLGSEQKSRQGPGVEDGAPTHNHNKSSLKTGSLTGAARHVCAGRGSRGCWMA